MDHKVMFLLVVGLALCSPAKACPGCPQEKDVTDPEIKEFLTLSLSKTLPTGSENEQTKFLKLNKATSQVVNGYVLTYDFESEGVKTHKLYNCHIVILDQRYKGELHVQEYSCQPIANRNKRSIVGGESEINLNEENGELSKYKQILSDELNKQQKSKNLMGVVKVLKATRQVVSGLVTRLTVEVAETDCLSGSKSQEKCSFQEKNHKICIAEVWEQPWVQKKQVTKLECNLNNQLVEAVAVTHQRKPYFCAGCPIETNPDDEVANQCLKRTLFNLNSQAHSSKTFKLLQITKVQTQVVAGIKYTIEFEAEDETHETYICNTVILLQPWITEEPSVVDFECTPLSKK